MTANKNDPALDSGQVGYAGNNVANVQSDFLGASPNNHTWTSGQPWFADNNVVTLWLNVTKEPLNDPKVRLAISAGIDRQQLSDQGETGYEPPATSSSGLLLPVDNALLNQSYSNDLAATSNTAKVSQLLTSDGYTKTGGKWMKNGQPIKFAIEDPSAYTDYATDAALIATPAWARDRPGLPGAADGGSRAPGTRAGGLRRGHRGARRARRGQANRAGPGLRPLPRGRGGGWGLGPPIGRVHHPHRPVVG
jgi:hypothetical protein